MSAIYKSGLLFGIISLLTNLGVGILMAICTPLCGIVWGAGAGAIAAHLYASSKSKSQPAI